MTFPEIWLTYVNFFKVQLCLFNKTIFQWFLPDLRGCDSGAQIQKTFDGTNIAICFVFFYLIISSKFAAIWLNTAEIV